MQSAAQSGLQNGRYRGIMRIAVCDNDRAALEQVVGMICSMDMVRICDSYLNIPSIIKAVEQGADYDIVVMNIGRDARFDGIDAAKRISELNVDTKIIYMTQYTEKYVQEIFLSPANLSGFLVKPVDKEMLKKNLQKVMETRQKPGSQKLEMKYRNETISILYEDILYLESMGHLVVVHTKKGDYRAYDRLEKVKERLPGNFVHCHKSYLVNMDWIQKIDKNRIFLLTGKELPISKSRYGETRDKYFLYTDAMLLALRNGTLKKSKPEKK